MKSRSHRAVAGLGCAVGALLLQALLPLGCAPPGRYYDNCPDGGGCSGRADGGPIDTTPFISKPVTVFRDGLHNSAADVVAFQGAAWAVSRNAKAWSPDGSGKLVVSRSSDRGATWAKTAELSLKDRDLRTPKLAVDGGKLLVIATAWEWTQPDKHHTLVVGATSDDGVTFDALATLGLPDGSTAWRPRALLGQLWLTSWSADEFYPSAQGGPLSIWAGGGMSWSSTAAAVPVGAGARQGEFLLRKSGELWAAIPERAVSGGVEKLTFCKSKLTSTPKWSCWSVPGLLVDSPALFEYAPDGAPALLLFAAKHDIGGGKRRTGLWQVLEGDQGALFLADLPTSQGDTGAPSVLPLDASHALLAFHSTSPLDPKVIALGQEPSELQAQSGAFAADVFAVELDLGKATGGR